MNATLYRILDPALNERITRYESLASSRKSWSSMIPVLNLGEPTFPGPVMRRASFGLGGQ